MSWEKGKEVKLVCTDEWGNTHTKTFKPNSRRDGHKQARDEIEDRCKYIDFGDIILHKDAIKKIKWKEKETFYEVPEEEVKKEEERWKAYLREERIAKIITYGILFVSVSFFLTIIIAVLWSITK